MSDFFTVFVFGKGFGTYSRSEIHVDRTWGTPIVIAACVVFDARIRSNSDRRV